MDTSVDTQNVSTATGRWVLLATILASSMAISWGLFEPHIGNIFSNIVMVIQAATMTRLRSRRFWIIVVPLVVILLPLNLAWSEGG